jgi:hypothetical protein
MNDAGAATSDASDDAAMANDAGGACNTIANAAPVVMITEETGATPTGTGGALVAGTYFTTAEAHYRASASDPASTLTSVRETVVLSNATASGAHGAYVFEPNGFAANAERVALELATNGSAVVFHVTCPAVADDATFDSYTATSTSVILYSSSLHLAVTLTKQ